MHQILESIVIALGSIWANKLRSFMTVLGNIVAVTSIVTVVSLIQGMNAMVSNAIVTDVGADAFTIQRLPPVRTAEDEERTRNNPLVTLEEADAIRRFSPSITSVMAQAQRRGRDAVALVELQHVRHQALEAAGVVVDDARQALAVLAALLLAQELGCVADGGQRIADLVRDAGRQPAERRELELLRLLAGARGVLHQEDRELLGAALERA